MPKQISDADLKLAVDITVAALGQSTSLTSHPEVVTKFLDAVAHKLDELRNGNAA